VFTPGEERGDNFLPRGQSSPLRTKCTSRGKFTPRGKLTPRSKLTLRGKLTPRGKLMLLTTGLGLSYILSVTKRRRQKTFSAACFTKARIDCPLTATHPLLEIKTRMSKNGRISFPEKSPRKKPRELSFFPIPSRILQPQL
jgi:hypothetical protein